MLYWILVFSVVVLMALALGVGGIVGASAGLVQLSALLFGLLVALSLIGGLLRRVE